MAIIQTIRNRAGVLVSIIIGLSLLAFILGDFITSGGTYFSNLRSNVLVANGKGISFQSFEGNLNRLEEETKARQQKQNLDDEETQAVREEAWNTLVYQNVFVREFDKLGLAVQADELSDLMSGQHLSPVVINILNSPESGIKDFATWKMYLSQVMEMEGNTPEKNFYIYIEDQVYNNRLGAKYNNLIKQGIYATNLEAKRRLNEISKEVSFSYVIERFNAADSSMTVSNSELKAYYKEHKESYKQEASRDIRFVYWEVLPSPEDFKKAENDLNEMVQDLTTLDVKNSIEYIYANSDTKVPVNYYGKGEFSDSTIDAFAFSSTENTIYGPYFEENHFKAAKVIKIDYLPDSVRASHIILQAKDQNEFNQNRNLADSLKKAVENGADFAAMAQTYSVDPDTKILGGDLGWSKSSKYKQAFSDSCFYGKTGDVYVNITNQGVIQIIKVTAQSTPVKKVQIGILNREVSPSSVTNDKFLLEASKFGSQNNTPEKFDAAVKTGQYKVVPINNLKSVDQNVGQLEKSRELVRWAFNNKEKSVTTQVYTFNNIHIVAIIDKAREKGYTPFEDLKSSIEIEVKKQKQSAALAAKLKEAANGATTLSAVAAKLGAEVKSETNIRFASYQIPGLGLEPKILGAVFNLAKGKLSQPIEGNNGVYLVQVDAETNNASSAPADSDIQKRMLENNYYTRIGYSMMTVLEDLAKLEDFRYKFY